MGKVNAGYDLNMTKAYFGKRRISSGSRKTGADEFDELFVVRNVFVHLSVLTATQHAFIKIRLSERPRIWLSAQALFTVLYEQQSNEFCRYPRLSCLHRKHTCKRKLFEMFLSCIRILYNKSTVEHYKVITWYINFTVFFMVIKVFFFMFRITLNVSNTHFVITFEKAKVFNFYCYIILLVALIATKRCAYGTDSTRKT